MSPKRVLITGGTGFLGSHAARTLSSHGYDITRTARNPKTGIEAIIGDLNNEDFVASLKKYDAIVHLAGNVSVNHVIRSPVEGIKNNIIPTLHLLEKTNEDRSMFIYASSDKVYGSPGKAVVSEGDAICPMDPYGASKAASENIITSFARTYGCRTAIIRFGNIYGPGQEGDLFIPSVIAQIRKSDRIQVGPVGSFRNFIFVSDAVAAIETVLAGDVCGTFNAATDNARMSDVLQTLLKIAEKYTEKRFIVISDKAAGRPASVEADRFELDCKKMLGAGWKPGYDLKKGLEESYLGSG